MACILRKQHGDVVSRLGQFDFLLAECIEVAAAGIGAAAGCTRNDIPSARGIHGYLAGTRMFRDVKLGQPDWDKSDADNFSSIVNHRLKLRFVVMNTNEATGLDLNEFPKNKSPKGKNSTDAVKVNLLPMFPDLPAAMRDPIQLRNMLERDAVSGYTTWYLCIFFSEESARAELSLPDGIDSKRYFSSWKERIILIDDNGPVRAAIDSETDEIEIKVRRRG